MPNKLTSRLAAVLLLTLGTAAAVLGDEAAKFFDDSAVREIRLYFDNPDWYNTLWQSHNSNPLDPYFPARLKYGNIELPKIGARFKGHSSFRRNGIKKSFKLDINEYDDNLKFLGLKKLNLHNGDLQPDFLHEKLFSEFAGKYVAAMRMVHVRLYVNDVFYGLYIAVEQPDKTMMQSRFGDREDGNLYEAGESVAANMSYLGPNPASYYSRYELKTNETANDYSGLINLLDVLNNTPTAQLPEKVEKVLDVENVLWCMALNTIFTNLESYVGTASEYYLYQRSSDNRFVHIHWDLNETFGSTGDGTPRLSNPFIMDPFWLPTGQTGPAAGGGAASNARPLLEKLWAVDQYKRLYLRMLARMLREGFNEASFAARVKELADRIRPHVYEDPNKPYTNAHFETALTNQLSANGFTTYGLTQFVRERARYLRPVLDKYASPSDLRLNEVVTINSGAQRDEAGDADPWVELHNLGPGPVSTAGFYLTDDPATPMKWAAPPRTLADGEFLVLWMDGETAEGANHVSFRTRAEGGILYLYSTGVGLQTPLDSVQYGVLRSGQSYARAGMYGSVWSLTATPTSAAENRITGVAGTDGGVTTGTGLLLVNEIMADNDGAVQDPDEPGAFEDWFEIYNPGNDAVDMSGMYITDNLNNPTKWRVPAGVSIPGKGHLLFMADGETAQGSRHTSWSLSKDGEAVGIYQADGKTLIDSVSFGPQRTDIAYGRTTDGAASWSLFSPATPGSSNTSALANWMVNGASFQQGMHAPEAIVSVFAPGLAASTAAATSVPLPTGINGVSVTVVDRAGVSRANPLYFVSPDQTNFQLAAGTASGKAKVTIRKQDGSSVSGDIMVDPVGPGVFSANASGEGVGLLIAIRVNAQGVQTVLPVSRYDAGQQKVVAVPISLGANTDTVHLVLFGTGIRGVGTPANVTARIGGTTVPVAYAGAQPEFPGLDQINVGPLPRSLAGKGEVEIVITAGGNRANVTTVSFE